MKKRNRTQEEKDREEYLRAFAKNDDLQMTLYNIHRANQFVRHMFDDDATLKSQINNLYFNMYNTEKPVAYIYMRICEWAAYTWLRLRSRYKDNVKACWELLKLVNSSLLSVENLIEFEREAECLRSIQIIVAKQVGKFRRESQPVKDDEEIEYVTDEYISQFSFYY